MIIRIFVKLQTICGIAGAHTLMQHKEKLWEYNGDNDMELRDMSGLLWLIAMWNGGIGKYKLRKQEELSIMIW